jgi:hypothetical protein
VNDIETSTVVRTSARRALAFGRSFVRSSNRNTSFVSVEASTEPVKKSPPNIRADITSLKVPNEMNGQATHLSMAAWMQS